MTPPWRAFYPGLLFHIGDFARPATISITSTRLHPLGQPANDNDIGGQAA